MGKRKTREQKKIAELRRKLSTQNPQEKKTNNTAAHEKSSSLSSYTLSAPSPAKKTYASQEYTYVYHDLYKTSLVMTIIIVLQLLLYFLLRMHILHVSFVQY